VDGDGAILRPVVAAFDGWRTSSGNFAGIARRADPCPRWLSFSASTGASVGSPCGCCGTRWQFKRTGCPFCETDSQRLASVAIEENPVCASTTASPVADTQTYNGQGSGPCGSDWSSLHLDLIAHDRG
jgi:FdhE protein